MFWDGPLLIGVPYIDYDPGIDIEDLPLWPPKLPQVVVGFSFGSFISTIASPFEDAASWLAGAGLTVIDATGNALVAGINGVEGFSSAVWSVAKSVGKFVAGLPGINIAVSVLGDATHLLRIILDSPITAICVVVVAAILNAVGLGGPLLAEYAMIRAGMDVLDDVEQGNTITIGEVAAMTLSAAGAATGLPLSAAAPALTVTQKIAAGQPITPADGIGLVAAAATVSAGISGDLTEGGVKWSLTGLAAAKGVATVAQQPAKTLKKQMPPKEHVTSANVASLPPAVSKQLATGAYNRAQGMDPNSPNGKAMTASMQRAQAELVIAARFQTMGEGLYADTRTALQRALDYQAIVADIAGGVAAGPMPDFNAPPTLVPYRGSDGKIEAYWLEELAAFQQYFGLAPCTPDAGLWCPMPAILAMSPILQSFAANTGTPVGQFGGTIAQGVESLAATQVSQGVQAPFAGLSVTQAYHPGVPPPPVLQAAPVQTSQVAAPTTPTFVWPQVQATPPPAAPPAMTTTTSPLPPVGLPGPAPAFHAPAVSAGPKYRARDVGQ